MAQLTKSQENVKRLDPAVPLCELVLQYGQRLAAIPFMELTEIPTTA